jgi:IclR family pca regulon transcriptional regulator
VQLLHESDSTDGDRPYELASLVAGLEILERLSHSPIGASPNELIEATGFERSRVARTLRTLVAAGYVERRRRGLYSVAPRSVALGARLGNASHLRQVAEPYLMALQTVVHETVNLAVLDGKDVIYLARHATARILAINLQVGSRLPAYCTSLGRAILAYLPAEQTRIILEQSDRRSLTDRTIIDVEQLVAHIEGVRQRGYAVTDGELEQGLRSAAAPVFTAENYVVGAVNVSVPSPRVSLDALRDEIVPALLRCTSELSRALGAPTT